MRRLTAFPRHPADLIARWPADRPLACVRWPAPDGATWTLFGVSESCAPSVRATDDPELLSDPVGTLNRMFPRDLSGASAHLLPFGAGWIVAFGYELGRILEPAVCRSGAQRPVMPAITMLPCRGGILHREPDALSTDHRTAQRWFITGSVPDALLRALAKNRPAAGASPRSPLRTGTPQWSLSDHAYRACSQQILHLIAAGDVYQVNLTRRLRCAFSGSSRHLAIAALRTAQPRHGAVVETSDGRMIISMSPELFLGVSPGARQIITRPIKGTRPAEESPSALLHSVKDTAELTMIVDLMRSDLGRISTPGSVRIARARRIETHGTVHHGVADIEGSLRPQCGVGDMLAATFAPGSVTGAPRIRAMQIIETLEPDPRGAYCGAIGFIDHCGAMSLNVAIRTMELTGTPSGTGFDLDAGILCYGTGGGIVADSCPDAELEETHQKTRVLNEALAHARGDAHGRYDPARAGS